MLCPSCGEPNPDRARYCLRCGVALVVPERREEERKVVSVLFCDLVGFTERSDRADPEDVKATLRPYHASIKRTVEGFGGTLDAFVGDGALVVFGAPTAHEDDAERAIHAAFRIQHEIETLNPAGPGRPLAVRIGIATGEAMVTLGRGPQLGERVTGAVVATSGRLQALAPVGGIAVGDATMRATRGRFEFEQLTADQTSVEGSVWHPIEVSRLVRERPDTPFVGRQEWFAVLRAAYRSSSRDPSVRLVTVIGEAGIGKSRLVQELAEYLDAEPDLIRWRVGRCLPFGKGVAFRPLTEMVKSEAGILENDAAAEARAKLTRSVGSLAMEPPDRDWLLARLAPLAGLGKPPGDVDRSERFAAWRGYLDGLAAQHPLVLVFEDLQWADEGSLAFIEELVADHVALPILVVCVGRPSLLEEHPSFAEAVRGTEIFLPPLTETETAILLSGLLDGAVLPARTQSALLERAGGNPLYTEEFVRMLADRSAFEDGGSGPFVSATEVPIPDTIQTIIAARLDALSHPLKTLVQDASVIGRVFWSGALALMDDARTRTDVDGGLRELARLKLVRPIETSAVRGDREYVFAHVLVRDVAYGQIPHSDRAGKHRAVAGWIESLAGERLDDRAELVAYHYGQALELSDVDDPDLRARAAHAIQLAGRGAFQLNADAAERHFRRALELMDPGDHDRPRILVRLAEVETSLARFADARRDFDAAIEAMEASGDRLGLGEALAMKSRALYRPGDTRESQQLLRRAIDILEAEPPGPELTRAYSRMAGDALVGGRFDECLRQARQALELAERLGLSDEIVRARQYMGAARCDLGDRDGIGDLWRAVRLGLETGTGVETAVAYSNLAMQLWGLEGPATAVGVWEAAEEFSRLRGFRTEELWARCGLLEVWFDLGRWDEVATTAQELARADAQEGGGQIRAFADVYRANVLTRRGELSEATLLTEEVLPRIRLTQRSEFLAPALTVAAVLEQLRGHHATAVQLVDEFAHETDGYDAYRLTYLPDAVRVLLDCDERERAAALVPEKGRARNVRQLTAIRTGRALLAEASGHLEDAARRFEACATAWFRYGSALERAHAWFGRGRVLRALGNEQGRAALELARDGFARLGAAPWLERLERLERPGPTGATSAMRT